MKIYHTKDSNYFNFIVFALLLVSFCCKLQAQTTAVSYDTTVCTPATTVSNLFLNSTGNVEVVKGISIADTSLLIGIEFTGTINLNNTNYNSLGGTDILLLHLDSNLATIHNLVHIGSTGRDRLLFVEAFYNWEVSVAGSFFGPQLFVNGIEIGPDFATKFEKVFSLAFDFFSMLIPVTATPFSVDFIDYSMLWASLRNDTAK